MILKPKTHSGGCVWVHVPSSLQTEISRLGFNSYFSSQTYIREEYGGYEFFTGSRFVEGSTSFPFEDILGGSLVQPV